MSYSDFGIRWLFRIAIFAVVLIAYLFFMRLSYSNVTTIEQELTEGSMRSEANYLCLQLESLGNRVNAFDQIVESSGTTLQDLESSNPEGYQLLSDPVGDILSGYTLEETGIVFITANGTVVASDSEQVPAGSDVRGTLGDVMCDAIEKSVETGQMQTVPYRSVFGETSNSVLYGDDGEGFLLTTQQGSFDVTIIKPVGLAFKNRDNIMGRMTTVCTIVLLVVFLIVDRLLSLMVARRIDKTNEALKRITSGDLETRVEEAGTREFVSLASGINTTVEALQAWIAEAETRMDSELAAARAIQESALPRTFPAYPDIPKFDLYASMEAAREVGGDFYDFFLIGDGDADSGKLGFVVADVSGKGVPASLFMMKAMTQIRDVLQSGMETGAAIEIANQQLVDSNEPGMFVTAWVGVLDYGTGHVEYVNAGHNPPLLWQEGTGWRWVKEKSGLPLGLFGGLGYESHSLDCEIGDRLVLYTDGVTEAMNPEGEQYGEDKLEALVNQNCTLHPQALVDAVRHDVEKHADGAEQSDDITILVLEFDQPTETEVPSETATPTETEAPSETEAPTETAATIIPEPGQ